MNLDLNLLLVINIMITELLEKPPEAGSGTEAKKNAGSGTEARKNAGSGTEARKTKKRYADSGCRFMLRF